MQKIVIEITHFTVYITVGLQIKARLNIQIKAEINNTERSQ